MGMFLAIIGMIAAGCLVAYVIALTVKWIVKKIQEKRALKNIKKVAIANIETIARECTNRVSLRELEQLVDEGYSQVMADIGVTGSVVGNVEVIKDTNDTLDEEVERLLGRDGQVVIEV